jgi:putative endonuclease
VSKTSLYLGKEGEDLALAFLAKRGYRCIARNFRTRSGEVDIIAADGPTVCFIEVKTRRGAACGSGADSVMPYKQRRIAQAALRFLQSRHLLDAPCRFDVVSIDRAGTEPRIDLIQNAFVLDENDEVSDV